MAKSRIKGITIKIGGDTTGLDKALKETNKKSRELESELKSVDKALKLDPNNVTLVKQKQDLLKDSIKETKSKLDVLKEAQSQITAQYKKGEIDAGQYRAFQRELETTKSKLSSLKDEKKNIHIIGTAFKEAKDKVEPVIKKVKKVGSVIDGATSKAVKFTATLGKIDTAMIGKAADGFKTYTTAVTGATTAVAGLAVSQVSNLDAIDKQSQALGLSRTAYQEWDYVLSQNGVDIEKFGTGMKSLLKNMDAVKEGNATATTNFNQLGVAVQNADGSLRSQEDVLKETVAAFQNMEDGADKTRLATELFGKQGQSLMPLLNGTAGSVDELMQKCNDLGMVVSDEAVDAGVKFSDTLDSLKRSAQGVFNTFASTGILTTFTKGMENMTDSVSDLLSAYKEGGLEGLNEEIPIVISNLFNSASEFLAENAPTLITASTTVLTSIIQSLAQLAPSLINSILPSLLNGFFGLINALVSTIPTLVPELVQGAITLFLGLIDGLNDVIKQLMPMLPSLIKQITDTLIENLPAIIEGGFQLLTGLITGLAKCTPDLIDAIIALIPVITDSLTENLPALVKAGMELIVALAQGLPDAIPDIINALPEIISAIIDGFKDVDWLDLGANILKGILNGLVSAVSGIWSVVEDVGSAIIDGFCDFFDIHSPSRVMAKKVGQYLPSGIAVGMEDTADEPVDEAQAIVDSVAGVSAEMDPVMIGRQNVRKTADKISTEADSTTQHGKSGDLTVVMNIDGKRFATVTAPYMDVAMAEKINLNARRAADNV